MNKSSNRKITKIKAIHFISRMWDILLIASPFYWHFSIVCLLVFYVESDGYNICREEEAISENLKSSQHIFRVNSRDSYKFHSIFSLSPLFQSEQTNSRDKNWIVRRLEGRRWNSRKVIDFHESRIVLSRQRWKILKGNPWKLSNFIVSLSK